MISLEIHWLRSFQKIGDENGELVLVQAWLNISSMSLKETGEGGLSSGVFLKNGCFNTQNNVPMLNRTNIPMLLRASYQNFRKQCADGSLSTDPASDIGLDRCIARCMTLHHSSRPFILHIRPANTIFQFTTANRLRIRSQVLILQWSTFFYHGTTLITT